MSIAPEYLPLADLSAYCGLSVKTLRGYLRDPVAPLPHYQPASKIVVRVSEFHAWMERFRHADAGTVDATVDELLKAVR